MLTRIKCDTSLTCCLDCHEAQLESDKEKVRELFEEIELLFDFEDDAMWLKDSPKNTKAKYQALKERWVE